MEINYRGLWGVFKRSIISLFNWNIGKSLTTGAGFGIITSLLIPFGQNEWRWEFTTAIKYGVLALVVLYVIRFIAIFIKEALKYFHSIYKESAYGDAIILLKDSFAETHHIRKSPDFQDKEFMSSMMIFCNNLKISFDGITKSNCSVSIKVPIKDSKVEEHSTLKNLTRDSQNSQRDTSKYQETEHTILGNSAFSNCLDNVLKDRPNKYYLNNDVNNENNYRNTSKDCYKDGILPYNSELVFPIVPLKKTEKDNFDCHGFLCIDSDKANIFDEKYAPAIVSGVADGIYDLIFQSNSESNEQYND